MLALMFPAPAPYPFNVASTSHKRPRGLWKGRRVDPYPKSRPSPKAASSSHDSDERVGDFYDDRSSYTPQYDDDGDSASLDVDIDDSSSCSSSKRRRLSGHFDFFADHSSGQASSSGSHTPLSDLYNAIPSTLQLPMSMSTATSSSSKSTSHISISSHLSISAKGKQPSTTIEFEDWENLKELFARAVERYDSDDVEALPLLRAVIRECHRFLKVHPDPSVIYTNIETHRQSRSPDAMTPTEERLVRDWGHDFDRAFASSLQPSPPPPRIRRTSSVHHSQQPRKELPTAFHAIFGTTLFLMGSLVAADPSILLPGEPEGPSTYWLGALDIFETGENLPSRTEGNGDTAEDWRMAIVWGRTLVCLADAKISHGFSLAKARAAGTTSPDTYCAMMNSSPFSCVEPRWPKDSPFHAIAVCRPPVTRRMSLYSASAHDIMILAMDQFSRGIFHMPHPQYDQAHNPSSHVFEGIHHHQHHQSNSHYAGSAYNHDSPSDPLVAFSRPKELFTIASEVLGVAERLGAGAQRHYWASWADSVFNQMKMEADMESWRSPITSARGRCWLVMGSAPVEEMEIALEKGDLEVLKGREAEDAREGLAMAISFFERAKGSAASDVVEDVSPLLAEALLTLANITVDENKREELYTRAQAELGEPLDLDGSDAMDES